MPIINVGIPEWVKMGSKNMRQQATIIPRSALIQQQAPNVPPMDMNGRTPQGIPQNMGPQPTDIIPAALSPGETVVPAPITQAAGGPQGVQQALNEKMAPQGIQLQGKAFSAGQDMPGYACGTVGKVGGYAGGTVGFPSGGSYEEMVAYGKQKEKEAATDKANAPIVSPVVAPVVAPKAIAPVQLQTPSTPTVTPAVAPANLGAIPQSANTVTGITPTVTSSSSPAPASPDQYVKNQLANPFNTAVRNDVMSQLQAQQGAQDIVQGQKLAEAGIDPTSAAGRTANMEQQVSREDTTGQAIAAINKQAMQNIKTDATNNINAMISAGDYEGANRLLAETGAASVDFSKVEGAAKQDHYNSLANYFDSLASAATANGDDTTAQAMTRLSSQYRSQGFQAVMGTDFDPTLVSNALKDVEAGAKTPEAAALHETADTVHSFFANDPTGQSALDSVIHSTDAGVQSILSKAVAGDDAAQQDLGDLMRAVYNQAQPGYNPDGMNSYDEEVLKKYDLVKTSSEISGTAFKLDDKIAGDATSTKRNGRDSWSVSELDSALQLDNPVTLKGTKYTVVGGKTGERAGVTNGKRNTFYLLKDDKGNLKTVSTRNGKVALFDGDPENITTVNNLKEWL